MTRIDSLYPSEKQIQKAIMQGLLPIMLRGDGYFNRTNTGKFKFKRNDGSDGFLSSGMPGQPDISGVYLGWPVYIECKTQTGRLSEVQIKAHELIKQAGGIVFIARSWDDVETEFAKIKDRH